MTVIRLLVALMLLPLLVLLGSAVLMLDVLNGTFFDGVKWDE
jgi:hypothetical protein